MSNDDIGFDCVPARYVGEDGVETIDMIRAVLGDEGFIAFCRGCVLKYDSRMCKKESMTKDQGKAKWYRKMVLHVQGLGPDPRAYRDGWDR